MLLVNYELVVSKRPQILVKWISNLRVPRKVSGIYSQVIFNFRAGLKVPVPSASLVL
jgi:hypothetical protein